MRLLLTAAMLAGLGLAVSGGAASAQGFSAISLIWHSSVVGYCEGRELTHEEAARTAIGFSGMWKAMRECRENRAKAAAAQARAAKAKKKR